jgi:hypothetical protein
MSWEDDIRKQLQSSGGELDAPGGGKYRLIGDNIWHYDAAEIAAEKEAQIKAQQDEERYKQAKSADSALADYYKNRQTADTVGQIDTNALSSLASAPKQPATPYDEAATRISLAGNADQAGDKTALDLLAKHQGPLQGLSEPVDLPAAPAADMAYQKTAAEKYADMQNRLGGMVTGNNSPVDIALDRAQKAAEMEQAAKEKADELNKKYGSNDGTPFEPGSDDYKIAEYIANNNIPVSQWRGLWTGFGKTVAAKPKILSTILAIKPDYDWKNLETEFKGSMSHASASGTLTPDIIKKRGELTHTTALAQLEPDVQTGKIEQQARGQTAKTLNNQRMAAQRAISTFDDALNKYGHYENIPEWMYRDLASDYAKILVSTGQIAEGSVDKVMQKTGKAAVVNLWNFATGDTKTTAPDKVLSLLHNRIKALNVDLDKQFYNQTKGANVPVNSNPNTNPLNAEPVKRVTKRFNLVTGKLEDVVQ